MTEVVSEAACWAVVPAAGLGRRMGGELPKQYLELSGRSVLSRTLDSLLGLEFLKGLVVALHPDDSWWPRDIATTDARLETVVGGEQRSDSVLAGLAALYGRASPDDWVLVHDAARPCLQRRDVERLRRELAGDPVGGLLALPVAETVKRADADGRVEATLDRRGLWLAQTPQMFRYARLRDCLQSVLEQGVAVTDESAAIERAGLRPRLVAGDAANIKITVPADLDVAEAWLAGGE